MVWMIVRGAWGLGFHRVSADTLSPTLYVIVLGPWSLQMWRKDEKWECPEHPPVENEVQ